MIIDDDTTDRDFEFIPENTKKLVFERDGKECWLCGQTSADLGIAHQIQPSALKHPFAAYKANGMIPKYIDLSHHDNLFPLCSFCHLLYDVAYPE